MKSFSTKHPIAFGVLLFFIALFAAAIPTVVIGGGAISVDVAGAIGRILVGLVLIVVFRSCLHWDRSFSALGLALPVLGIVAWNGVYHLMSGSGFVTPSALPGAVLCGLAPGIFEEVIFRGVLIDRLRESGKGPWYVLVASALVFGLIHLTNAAGMDLPSLLVQALYSTVVGLLFGAIYLRSDDIATVILAHAAIDLSNQIFATQPATSSIPMLVAFVAVLVALLAYALWLLREVPATQGQDRH